MKRITLIVLLFLLQGKFVFAQVNLNQGLMAYYPFTGNANDVSGNNNHGTVNGATLCADKFGNPNSAYFFDGVNDFIQVANSASINFPNNTFSYYALIKVQGFYNGPCHGNIVIDKGNSDYISGSYSLRFSDGYSLNFLNCNSPVTVTQQNYYPQFNTISFAAGAYMPYIDTSAWDCIVVTGDGANIKLYLNGQLKQNLPMTSTLGVNAHDMFFGRKNSAQYPYWFRGIMDEIRIYNRALNIQEIDSLCNACVVTLNVPPVPPICAGQSTPLSVTGASTYLWVPSTGLSNANIANPVVSPNATTTYTVTGTNANGCSATTTVTINVGASLNIVANPSNVVFCAGESMPLNCLGSATSYSWQPVVGLSNASVANPIANPMSSTIYTVTASNAQGCTGTATVFVQVWQPPVIDVNPSNSILCQGDSILLQASGGIKLMWLPNQDIRLVGSSAAYVKPTQTTTYTITGFDLNNCSDTTTAVVNVYPKPIINIQSVGSDVCVGDSLLLTASGAIDYFWEPTLSVFPSNGNPVYVFPTQATTYTVTGIDALGCENTATLAIDISTPTDFKVVKYHDIECGFNEAQLFATGADTYSWWPTTGLNNSSSAMPTVQIDETTTYYVSGQKGNCLYTDSITVFVYKNNEAAVFIPNAFSPNGDGVNDCIRPLHKAHLLRYFFTVYNRYGNCVFSTYDPNECWSGQQKGRDADVGTYFYYIKATTPCGEIFKKGDIMLMR